MRDIRVARTAGMEISFPKPDDRLYSGKYNDTQVSLGVQMKISTMRALGLGVATGALLLAASPSRADDQMNSQIQALQQQIRQMQQQLQLLQTQVNQTQAQAPPQGAPANAPRVTESATHRFGLSSADGQNTIELTGRLHIDTGDYLNYKQGFNDIDGSLGSGINARRARIGVDGKFLGDFTYALIYDFGGNSDSLNANNAFASSNSTKFTPTASTALSGVENAFISYNGLYTGRAIPIAFDFGYMDVPWTLDESTSSNDIMFLERSSSQVVATEFGGGDSRSAFGARSNNDRYFVGAYLTGPQAGALHTTGSECNIDPVTGKLDCVPAADGHMVQLAALGRASYQIIQTNDLSLHIGANAGYTFKPRTAGNDEGISLSDRPELRVDPTSFLATGNIDNVTSGDVLGAEAAFAWQNAFLQGEYFHYDLDRASTNGGDLNFDGGYIEASYSFGGRRRYNPATGAYTGVIPEEPLSLSMGSWGAVELAARYSVVDLNDGSATSKTAVLGGKQTVYAVGINYYPNLNMRFMLDYLHGKNEVPTGAVTSNLGADMSYDAIALRTQINF
jgi:phosphate-selective porin OprO and OprP